MSNKSYLNKVKKLKALGVISYDLRKNLSSSQRGVITKKLNEYGLYLRRPELFHAVTVNKKTSKILRELNYKVTARNRAIIPLNEFTSVSIRNNELIYRLGNMSERVQLAGAKEFHPALKKLSKRKLKNNEMITVQIGANSPFRKRFISYEELFNYLMNDFNPQDISRGNRRQKVKRLMAKMSIVTVNDPNFGKTAIPKFTSDKKMFFYEMRHFIYATKKTTAKKTGRN